MAFQTVVTGTMADGVVGELAFEGPQRAQPAIMRSANAAANIFGRAFTHTGDEGVVQAGGTGRFAGILSNPKAHVTYGTQAGGPFAPTQVLPNETIADFTYMAIMFVNLAAPAPIGARVVFDTSTGANAGVLSTLAPDAEPAEGQQVIGEVVRYTVTAPGLAVIEMTNH